VTFPSGCFILWQRFFYFLSSHTEFSYIYVHNHPALFYISWWLSIAYLVTISISSGFGIFDLYSWCVTIRASDVLLYCHVIFNIPNLKVIFCFICVKCVQLCAVVWGLATLNKVSLSVLTAAAPEIRASAGRHKSWSHWVAWEAYPTLGSSSWRLQSQK
jgi:hypothetical protein